MKGEPDSISKDREPKGLKYQVPRGQAKMEQEPSERKNYSGKQARVSELKRQRDNPERLILRQPYPGRSLSVGHLSASRELQRNKFPTQSHSYINGTLIS